MFPFHYCQISRDFIEDLKEKVLSSQSVVLLGPRFSGKRQVIDHLQALLREAKAGPDIRLGLLTETLVTTNDQAQALVRKAVADAFPDFEPRAGKTDHLLDLLEQLADHLHRPVILLAANIDGLSHHLARSFLQSVRTLVEAQKLIAVISGEDSFHDLVHGENSEFTSANQFVLQGYEEIEFNGFVRRYLQHTRLRFSPEQNIAHHIWKLAGGNIYNLKIILWAIVHQRTRVGTPPDQLLTIEEIPGPDKLMATPAVYVSQIFRHATQLIDREPGCWDDLEHLLKGGPIFKAQKNTPTRLELAGVAIRKYQDEGEYLALSSPLMEAFVKQYYDQRRMGDLYGSDRRWEKAFERYKLLDHDSHMRPSGADDRGSVDILVNALGSSLYSKATPTSQTENATGIIEALKNLFAQGCYYILGFREITFWYRNSWQQTAGWECRKPDGFTFPPQVLREIESYLSWDATLAPEMLRLRDPGNRFALAARLPALRQDQQVAVVVSDFEKRTVISRERERLARQLLDYFIKSYTHAVSIDGLHMRQRVRSKHMEIINTIFNALGSPDLSMSKLLEMAAQDLRHLEYRRVVFSLVDPEKRMIDGVHEDCDESVMKIFKRIHWALDDPTADLQPFVIHSKEFWVISDAATDLYADRNTLASAGIRTAVVVPILTPTQEAIGTILVERDNGAVPSHDEANDLKAFGRQLAIAIEQCERVNLLESCLNKIPEPLLILDRKEKRRYQNKPAADLFGGGSGWAGRKQLTSLPREKAGPIIELSRESLESGHRRADYIQGIGSALDYQGEVIADVIEDWRGKAVGGFLRIQDRTYLHQYFEAERRAAEASDLDCALRNMLEAMLKLGHKWGRLYLVRETSDGVEILRSELSYGHSDPEEERKFNEHKIVLARRDEPESQDWLCLDNKAPVVFCWLKDRRDREIYVTPRGLRAVNWPDPKQPSTVQKRPGDFWVDFPLISGEKSLGKICLQCNENFQPEHFELLKHLSITWARILSGFLLRARSHEEKEESIKLAVVQKTMATMAHNIGTRHGSLPILLRRYRNREKKLAELKKINDEFAHIVEHILATIKRAKELLSPVNVKRAPVNIVETIRRILHTSVRPEAWRLKYVSEHQETGAASPLMVRVDAHLLETALLEMIQNSRDQISNEDELLITINIKLDEQQDGIRILYEDNGPGVPPGIEERIFEDFFSHRPNQESAGTGLGMGFILRVIEGHGGKIAYQGKPGEGAKFLITLPKSIINETIKENVNV